MNAPLNNFTVLEPRPLYGIGTVARLTGLKPDTLRVWERRYGLGASYKSASGRRQYTQSDLEHLQLIAALVNDGARIGEIASSERKTLELLLKSRGKQLQRQLPPAKPQVVFVGESLCNWLDEHQGCISSVSALLCRRSLADAVDNLLLEGPVALLVVECAALSNSQINAAEVLAKQLNAGGTLVMYKLANERWLEELERRGVSTLEFPPETARLAYEMGKVVVTADTEQGEFDLGDLVQPKPRRYNDTELLAAAKLKNTLNCECPKHLSDLLLALNQFEEYSTQCSVENWQDAAVHASVYAYTNQARHLMEKALTAVLEEREVEYTALVQAQAKL